MLLTVLSLRMLHHDIVSWGSMDGALVHCSEWVG
uniref:Uncharacterized protein n=1 Tax=Arundo donax TaxID=35708 RepID=A0A0A8XQS0_ARUDO